MREAIYWARETFVVQFRNEHVGRRVGKLALSHLKRQVRGDKALYRKLKPELPDGLQASPDLQRLLPRAHAAQRRGRSPPASARCAASVVVGADGTEREVDTIIFGTGFHVADQPMQWLVTGKDGKTLGDVWNGSMHAYNGCAVAGFPNFFLLLGPNTGLGHNSVVVMIEAQIDYVMRALRALRQSRAREFEVTKPAMEAFRDDVDRLTEGTVWVSPGCNSYYLDATGRNAALWPTTSWSFRRRVARFDTSDHELRPLRTRQPFKASAVGSDR